MSAELAQPLIRQRRASIAPRFIRASEAPAYLGMCRDEFNKTVRPSVREFPIGKQGVAFDREELDAWADAYVESKSIEKLGDRGNNQPCIERQGESKWRENRSQVSPKGRVSGISTRKSTAKDFTKLLEQLTDKRPSGT